MSGIVSEVDGLTDIWAVGATMFVLLSGRGVRIRIVRSGLTSATLSLFVDDAATHAVGPSQVTTGSSEEVNAYLGQRTKNNVDACTAIFDNVTFDAEP